MSKKIASTELKVLLFILLACYNISIHGEIGLFIAEALKILLGNKFGYKIIF